MFLADIDLGTAASLPSSRYGSTPLPQTPSPASKDDPCLSMDRAIRSEDYEETVEAEAWNRRGSA
jgi:hypothetical protein